MKKTESKVANRLPQSILTVISSVLTALMNRKGLTLTPIRPEKGRMPVAELG